MSEQNPYAVTDDQIFAADAPVDERVVFLKKTYSLMTFGLLVFAATLWAAGNVPAINGLAIKIYSPWMPLIILFGGSLLVHAVATKPGINLVAYFGFLFFFALVSAPFILTLAAQGNGPTIINQAALLTAVIFIGLSAYVYYSGKDFGFLGGILFVGMLGLIAIAIIGWVTGFGVGLWFSGIAVILLSGYILYDTSNILHRYPTNMHVSAALELTVDVILLFKNLALILWSLQND